MSRILPISSIRFVLAIWVVMSHFGLPILREPSHNAIVSVVRAVANNAFSGQAAVIVFFVISGFCIHFPNRKQLTVPSWKAYYLRRYARILIPMTVAIALSIPLRMEFGLFTYSILWSLLCEEIYYFLYPGLLALRDRAGWGKLMTLAWTLAFLTVLTNPRGGNYHSYGSAMNWILGLPCWLLGCRMAERLESFYSLPVTVRQIWMWRAGAWALSTLLSALRYHTPIGYPWTLNLFAVFAVFWLEREIRYYHSGKSQPVFESPGEASYSIYLTHTHGAAFLLMLSISKTLSPAGLWFWSMILCGSFSAAFYWMVERPSHHFARRFARQATVPRRVEAVSAR